MPYSPSIIGSQDYGDIRLALGFAADATTDVTLSLIEGRSFLRWVEGRVVENIPTCATILNTADANYDAQRADALKNGVVLWTASRIAALWFAARVHKQLVRNELGPAKVQYHDGPDWMKLATDRAGEAADELFRVDHWGEGAQSLDMVGLAGKTRKARDARTQVSLCEWQARLLPPVALGQDYPYTVEAL